MFGNLTGWHALIVLVIILLLFGATKLPTLARSVGQSMQIFKKEVASPPSAPAATGSPTPTPSAESAPRPGGSTSSRSV
jgi:sec-independent protein translocase protein TatA